MRSESVICKIADGLYFWILGKVCMRNSRQTNFRDAYFYENTRKYKSKDNGTEWIKSQKEIKMLQGQTAGMILLKTYCYVYCWIG